MSIAYEDASRIAIRIKSALAEQSEKICEYKNSIKVYLRFSIEDVKTIYMFIIQVIAPAKIERFDTKIVNILRTNLFSILRYLFIMLLYCNNM